MVDELDQTLVVIVLSGFNSQTLL